MGRDADRRSFSYIGETCPSVRRIEEDFTDELSAFVERVKEASSYKLREALTQACSDLIDTEEEVNRLRDERDRLQDEVSALRSRIAELEIELESVHER